MQDIDFYFTKIRKKITELESIDAEDIIFEKFRNKIGRIYGRIFFRDRSMLEFLEMIIINKKTQRPKYRFHWQDNEGNLIIRCGRHLVGHVSESEALSHMGQRPTSSRGEYPPQP